MNDLFADQQPLLELLPYDGSAVYYGQVLPSVEADDYFHRLWQEIDWQHDEAIVYGKHIITKRKVAWYADQPFHYTYSKTTKTAQLWTPLLLELRHVVEALTQVRFNSCLLNLYHDGSEGMAWHSDAEKELLQDGTIASLSFGVERKFSFKHKVSQETRSIQLEHGSLLVMQGTTQSHWLHSLPTTKKAHNARINLTFRQIRTTSFE
ncbi:alpha-ketoglutarate-dependent dioxygenase AlkB family protein [Marinomonas fungiae]|uniref:Alkylated DNA repair dioxygenase AlkB n=1 Tax=Marinomonas fungiae TaxID=1137284 RepID=A0A0K6IMQ7_9GAMM|nr:alpha-ketoglutarate-dependent dioxygenase AlkB [Marinomonas fungiae]CUB04384.1 Alkylated DNA repair dioxygenase AlkB [Marinomonas fungiae]